MYKKKPLLITFEGIEGSGKSFQSKKLFKKLKSHGYDVIYTREPGGSLSAEQIRNVILTGSKNKFLPVTDTLLYLAARNEHINKLIIPLLKKKKIVICDRFIDSTIAYQVYGKKVNRKFIDHIHKHILNGVKPNITFVLKVSPKSSKLRLKKRKSKNRYDNFPQSFYTKAQKTFLKLARKGKNYYILDSSSNDINLEKKIFEIISKRLKIK